MKQIDLRDYQVDAVEQLRSGIRAGHRSQILCAPTGAGKTTIAAYLMQASASKGMKCAFVVDRVALVDQTSAVLDAYGIDHGVIQAGHWRRRMYEPIQVCSAQTLEKRGFFPELRALYVDEAHCQRAATTQLIKNHPELVVIGLTATPLTKGLAESYSRVVNVTTVNRLIADGWLVPLVSYAAVTPDMTGAKVVAGEWSPDDIEKRGNAIVGDIVGEWQAKTLQHFGRPVKTLVFSATVAHGEEICRQFAAAGHDFRQLSYKDGTDDERREIIAEFRKPDSTIRGLVSCEVLTKGFDVPDVLCGISARPYRKSLSSHIQQLGRVIRPADGKTFALWLDHSGNFLRFYDDQQRIFEEGVPELSDGSLDKPRKEPTEREREARVCSCGMIIPTPPPENCPKCGKSLKRRSMIENVAGEMIEVGERIDESLPAYLRDRAAVWRQLCWIAQERKGDNMEAARRFAQAQYRNLYGGFARHAYETTTPERPSLELHNKVRSLIIRWAKSHKRAA